MGFPGNLVGQRAAEAPGPAAEPFGPAGILVLIGVYFAAALLTGFFLALVAFTAMRSYRAFDQFFPVK